MKTLLLFFLTLSSALGAEPAKSNADERFSYYEKAGLGYAKLLYQDPKSDEEESRATKTELLNIKIRSRTIDSTKGLLAKTTDKNLRRELIQRLAVLENEQAETYGHINNKKSDQDASLRRSIDYYAKLLREFPGWRTDISLFRSAEAQDKLGKSDEAMKLYQHIIKDFPKSTVRADSLLALGNIYFDRKAFGIAENTYRQILSTPEETLHAYAHYKMAWCRFNTSDFNPAITELEAAIKESRKLQAGGDRRLGVEDEALSDLVLFFAEYGNPLEAKDYFEKIATKEKAKSMRFDLARRLFDYGKHVMARSVASELLADSPAEEYTHKLYLILISVAERLQDRNLGLETARKLTAWLGSHKVEEVVRADAEEYLRLYAEKLHHEAETIKKKELWSFAKSGYEIYLAAFPKEKETPEIQFRYAVLLMSVKQPFAAYTSISNALAAITNKHPRFKESLHLRIQTVEFCSKDERQSITDKNIVIAYDEFSKNDLKDPLSAEAAYKAAEIAKSLESPEQLSKRYQDIASTWPSIPLAKNAARQSLAVLINANKWDALKVTTENMRASTADAEFSEKIREAHELAQLKIIEDLEKNGKIAEAKSSLNSILQGKHSEVMGLYALTRLASIAEKESAKQAIPYFDKIQKEYPNSKEAKNALLNMARLNTKILQPKLAIDNYLAFAGNGNSELEVQARMNAAILLESMGNHAKAGALFSQVSDTYKHQKGGAKEAAKTYEAACNNYLFAAGDTKQSDVLKKLADCANDLAGNGDIKWEARAAWANAQGGKSAHWERLARHKAKELKEDDKFYVAMARIHLLETKLEDFKSLKFSKTNEKPMANITKKSDAMDAIEKSAAGILEIASQKQAISTQKILRAAYLDFADTMTNAALPSHVSEAERNELKKSFITVATDFTTKAKALAPPEDRKIASVAAAVEAEEKIPELNGKDEEAISAGNTNSPDLLGKMAYAKFKKGDFGEARYFSIEWQKNLEFSKASDSAFNQDGLEKFHVLLSTKYAERDPVNEEF